MQVSEAIIVGIIRQLPFEKIGGGLPVGVADHRIGDALHALRVDLLAARQFIEQRVGFLLFAEREIDAGHALTGAGALVAFDSGCPLKGFQGALEIAFGLLDAGDAQQQLQVFGMAAAGFHQRLTALLIVAEGAVNFRKRQVGHEAVGMSSLSLLELFDQLLTLAALLGD